MAFDFSTFSGLVTTANPKFERLKESSLHELMKMLESLKRAPTADQKANLQLLFAFIPHEKKK
jgi:hypothetical protein